ncbi:hypothetical protein [Paenibacillus tyrfis]|uniref:Uncharacterized protein n=1 Tax=Paenibacillus tyrfis TaxID=1501230 RepID=A0A081NY89_9BACL|nr:hypothetical protein [Paenibacillus tyrfis]KEQ23412.1 hypothetical protein ET33_16400 [Paenibacillus tyrfis]
MNDFVPGIKFEWIDRVACVEALAAKCVDIKFEEAMKGILLTCYCKHPERMTRKQESTLKRDVMKRAKDIKQERASPEIGDTVRVAKLAPNPLLGGLKQDGKNLVEAIVVDIRRTSFGLFFKVKRLSDGEIQEGNGHMIKAVVRRARSTHEVI